jgi:hypothetical protein
MRWPCCTTCTRPRTSGWRARWCRTYCQACLGGRAPGGKWGGGMPLPRGLRTRRPSALHTHPSSTRARARTLVLMHMGAVGGAVRSLHCPRACARAPRPCLGVCLCVCVWVCVCDSWHQYLHARDLSSSGLVSVWVSVCSGVGGGRGLICTMGGPACSCRQLLTYSGCRWPGPVGGGWVRARAPALVCEVQHPWEGMFPMSASWTGLLASAVPDPDACPYGAVPQPPPTVTASPEYPGDATYRRSLCVALCGRAQKYNFLGMQAKCVGGGGGCAGGARVVATGWRGQCPGTGG